MRRATIFAIILGICALFLVYYYSQDTGSQQLPQNHVVSISHKVHNYSDGQSVIVYKLHIKPGWYVYNQEKSELGRSFIIKLEGEGLEQYRLEWPLPEEITKTLEGREIKTSIYRNELTIPIEVMLRPNSGSVSLHVNMSYGACDDQTCIPAHLQEDIWIQHTPMQEASVGEHYLYMLLIALLGGLVMNLMPCVLPVIGLKLYSVLNTSAKDMKIVRLEMLSTAAGILCTFWGLAVLTIVLSAMGRQVFWGMHFQSPIFLITLILMLSAMVTNLMGYYEISVPSGIATRLNMLSGQVKVLEHFLVGVIATIMASPCLAPFLAVAIAYALTKQAPDILLIYSAIGTGMALPFLLLASKPKLLLKLPKPGRWMYWLKWLFALVMLAASIWLLLILYTIIQPAGAAMVLLGVIILNFILVSRFSARYSGMRPVLFVCALLLAFAAPWVVERLPASANAAQALNAAELPAGWSQYSEDALQDALLAGRRVVVNVGAQWCLTCKWNKKFVLDSQEVQAAFQKHNILLLYADYTDYSEPVATLLKRYKSYGVPTTIVYGPGNKDGILMPTLLSSDAIISAICMASDENR